MKKIMAGTAIAMLLAGCSHDSFRYKTHSAASGPDPRAAQASAEVPSSVPACSADITFSRWAFLQNRSFGMKANHTNADGTVDGSELSDGQQVDNTSVGQLVGLFDSMFKTLLPLAVGKPPVPPMGAAGPRASEPGAQPLQCIPAFQLPGASSGASS